MTDAPAKTGNNAEKLPKTAKVLLVDDEENILRALQRVLRREPWELTTASSGEDALEILAEQKFDLVISDARMPGMDGPTLLAEIRRKYQIGRASCRERVFPVV